LPNFKNKFKEGMPGLILTYLSAPLRHCAPGKPGHALLMEGLGHTGPLL